MAEINENIRTVLYPVPVKASGATEISLYTDTDIKESKRIIKIETFSASQVSHTPDKSPVISDAVLKKSSLSLSNSNGTAIRHLALPTISRQNNTLFIEEINLKKIGLEKCKILIGDGVGVNAGDSFLFQITYEK